MMYLDVLQAKEEAEYMLDDLQRQEKEISIQVNYYPENEELIWQLKIKQESIRIIKKRIEHAQEKLRNMAKSIVNEQTYENER
ncbi:MAG TPA: hypothetical protein VIK72_14865 [Clostridiaceae bacterium]